MTLLELKRWDKAEYWPDPDDKDMVITMELKRMKRHEARVLLKSFVSIMKEMELLGTEEKPRTDLTESQKAEIMTRVFDQVPEEQLRDWFTHSVRDVGGLSIDGVSVTTGQALLDEADDALLFFVLTGLIQRSRLSPREVKASASPSTSLPAPKTADGSSPVKSIEGEALPTSSTVLEISAVAMPSSAAE